MHIGQRQQKVYGVYEINSNFAHLQPGWEKNQNQKPKGLIFIFKKQKKVYRWIVILMNSLIAQQKRISFLNKAFYFYNVPSRACYS